MVRIKISKMTCRVCLWEEVRKGSILRVVSLEREKLKSLLAGITFEMKAEGACVDLMFPSRAEKEKAKEILGDRVYSERESLEEVVGRLLKDKGYILSVAESCTGGLLGAKVVNVPGSSAYFMGGVIVYSNELKQKLLGVKEETLRKFGAVSPQTCHEMLEGLKDRFGTDAGIAITGIAGPGGSTNKPEGLTYIGVYLKDKTEVSEYVFGFGRNLNRLASCQIALDTLRRMLW